LALRENRLPVLAKTRTIARSRWWQSKEMVALGGYLKSTKRRGGVLVADRDRTSLHLDLIARDRGLKRYPGSRYETVTAAAIATLR